MAKGNCQAAKKRSAPSKSDQATKKKTRKGRGLLRDELPDIYEDVAEETKLPVVMVRKVFRATTKLMQQNVAKGGYARIPYVVCFRIRKLRALRAGTYSCNGKEVFVAKDREKGVRRVKAKVLSWLKDASSKPDQE